MRVSYGIDIIEADDKYYKMVQGISAVGEVITDAAAIGLEEDAGMDTSTPFMASVSGLGVNGIDVGSEWRVERSV